MKNDKRGSFVERHLNPKALFRRHFLWRRTLERFQGVIVQHHSPAERRDAFERTRTIAREIETLLSAHEAYQLFALVRRLRKIPGALAELGVYRGGSARIILEASDGRELHLFDTFTGLPAPNTTHDAGAPFAQGNYSAGIELVRSNLAAFTNVRYHAGFFPQTTASVAEQRFSFVHVDADLHQSTLDALDFFYARMTPGGVMLFHDSIQPGGARRAIESFFETRREAVLELGGNQSFVVKL